MDQTKRTHQAEPSSAASDTDPRVSVVVEFFRRDLSRRISVDELSASVSLSPSGLRRLFRQQMGCSIGKWQRAERLREARSLLRSTCLSVKEINAAVGYHDLSHFVRDFERAFGLSPAKFRRANLDINAVLRTDKPTKHQIR